MPDWKLIGADELPEMMKIRAALIALRDDPLGKWLRFDKNFYGGDPKRVVKNVKRRADYMGIPVRVNFCSGHIYVEKIKRGERLIGSKEERMKAFYRVHR